MPNASAPNAPCVDVWLSPQTIVMPGCVRPSSGPITCTMPSRPLPVANSRTPNSSQLRSQRLELRARERVRDRAVAASGRCDPSSRPSGPAGAPAGRRAAAPRTPAATSPRGPGAGRRRAAPARPCGSRDDVRVPDLLEQRAHATAHRRERLEHCVAELRRRRDAAEVRRRRRGERALDGVVDGAREIPAAEAVLEQEGARAKHRRRVRSAGARDVGRRSVNGLEDAGAPSRRGSPRRRARARR